MPGAQYCCAYGCRNNTKTHREKSYFKLPPDPEKLALWLSLISREDLLEKAKSGKLYHRICSDHFSDSSFTYIKSLNQDAIPRLKLISLDSQEDFETNASSFEKSRLDTAPKEKSTQTIICGSMESSSQANEGQQNMKSQRTVTVEVELEEDTTKPSVTKQTFLEWCDQFLNEKMSNIVKCHASLIDQYKGNRYTMDFKLFSLQMYYSSPHAYRHLQQVFHFPPISTLQSMQIPISTGVNEHFLKALKYKTSKMTEKEKMCTICIGTMSLKAHLCYEISKDKVHGLHEIDNVVTSIPAKHAVVIMVRGMFHEWKQPVGYALTAECRNYPEMGVWIDKVIHTLLEIGLYVRAVISDLESNLFSRNISTEKPWFEIYGKKIHHIFDAPHLIKCARNDLIHYDFHYGSKVAKWQHIEQAYDRDSANDLKLMYKLTEKHVKPNKIDRMLVKLAAQTFSRSVAAAMNVYVATKLIDDEAKDTVELIYLLNNLFDMLNSASVFDDYAYKRAYQGKDEQKQFLLETTQFFERLILKKLNKTPKNVDFIKGFIITIKSVMSLFEDLKLEGHNFLLTRNLNRDCLENFFCQIRKQSGNFSEPTALKFNRVFRKIFSINIMKPTKQGTSEDDLNSVLVKVNDYIRVSNETSNQNVRETPIRSSVKVGTTDYRLDLPQGNAFIYITAYLLRKCLVKHRCQKMVDYFNAQEKDYSLTRQTLLTYYEEYNEKNASNAGVGLITPPLTFIKLVQNLEYIFVEYFRRNRQDLSQMLGSSILAEMRRVTFEMPCECFPLHYFRKLFIRCRIFAIVKDNNKMLKTSRKHSIIKCIQVSRL